MVHLTDTQAMFRRNIHSRRTTHVSGSVGATVVPAILILEVFGLTRRQGDRHIRLGVAAISRFGVS